MANTTFDECNSKQNNYESRKWKNHGQMGNTPYNVLGVRHTRHVFLIWLVKARASAIICFSHPCLVMIDFPFQNTTILVKPAIDFC